MFFVVAVVKLVVSVLSVDDNIMSCFDCFLYGADDDKCPKAQTSNNSNSNSNSDSDVWDSSPILNDDDDDDDAWFSEL